MKYKPLRSLSNLIPINARFRAAYEAIGELKSRLDAIEGKGASANAESFDESEQTIAEPKKESESVGDESWRDIKDASALKEFALEMWGFEIKGNKKPETIIAEIDEFLEAQKD